MLTRLLLRFAALGLKFALTVVIARTLGFDAVAAYGLAVAASVIASKALGLGFGPELNRRLSETNPLTAIDDARALSIGYGALYLLMAASFALVATNDSIVARLDRFALSVPLAWCVLLVALSEHAAFEVNGWLFSLHRPRAGSVLLFVRTGVWSGLACAGLLAGVLHSIEAVLALWIATNAAVVAVGWRKIRAFAQRVRGLGLPAPTPHPRRMWTVWRRGLPFYAAAVILASLQYAERFIAGGRIGADALGQYVFAWSIANAVQTVAFATVAVTAGPRLVRTLADTPDAFLRRTWQAIAASAAVTLLVSTGIVAAHRTLFAVAHEPVETGHVALLAVLLGSFVLRAAADVLWSAAIALRAGGVVLTAIAGLALLYVPVALHLISASGAEGAALAHLAASIAIATVLALIVARRAGDRRTTPALKEPSHAG
ncbi:putative polysaccharide biosynthesis transporter protein [Burkholderia aenigmatica]|uniref:Putative polysaccharide biosynthesis transporter protein n=1 Tax=Burkholderia aenigmatica TaxID=2015348 RepID=A0A6P2KV00_9BURK|nr:oligosaccharide flippase family protein [Burkholderia aenigmatica]VWB62140.1 putative polysaccharide biosynthesis transporter protein [Burkholderia aenigmatica]